MIPLTQVNCQHNEVIWLNCIRGAVKRRKYLFNSKTTVIHGSSEHKIEPGCQKNAEVNNAGHPNTNYWKLTKQVYVFWNVKWCSARIVIDLVTVDGVFISFGDGRQRHEVHKSISCFIIVQRRISSCGFAACRQWGNPVHQRGSPACHSRDDDDICRQTVNAAAADTSPHDSDTQPQPAFHRPSLWSIKCRQEALDVVSDYLALVYLWQWSTSASTTLGRVTAAAGVECHLRRFIQVSSTSLTAVGCLWWPLVRLGPTRWQLSGGECLEVAASRFGCLMPVALCLHVAKLLCLVSWCCTFYNVWSFMVFM